MSGTKARRPIEYYLDLRYPVLVSQDDEGGYVAEIPDLPGCATQAEALDQLFEMIEDAKRAWIEATYQDGRELPLPRTEDGFSGKFIVRVPASLHRRLARAAEDEGVSLNQYVSHLLGVGASLDFFSRRVESRLDDLDYHVAAIEQSLRYQFGEMPRASSPRARPAPIVTFTPGGTRRAVQAVAG